MIFGRANTGRAIALVVALGVTATLGFVGFVTVGRSLATTSPIAVAHEDDGLMFTMSLQGTVFPVGQTVNITFTVRNVGFWTIDYTLTEPEFDFIVNNSAHDQIYRWTTGQAFPMFCTVLHLQPGEYRTSVLSWPQAWHQSVYTGEGVQVPLGQYSIVGKCDTLGWQVGPLEVIITLL
ncbi:MAG TPA: BsuPI-related putative proteinase inhibitor [Candidatus Lokiarchaeia archaeon]|nr:BsuPI-related putative proteinase inhibitor [Candidatus Lokiarchaeia archaeon]